MEELGGKAGSEYSFLRIAQIKGNQYRIRDYDGMESLDTPESIDWITIN